MRFKWYVLSMKISDRSPSDISLLFKFYESFETFLPSLEIVNSRVEDQRSFRVTCDHLERSFHCSAGLGQFSYLAPLIGVQAY